MVITERTQSRRRAFVMVEVLAAFALLTGGVFMAVLFFRAEVRELRFTHERFAAMLIAQSEIERLHTLPYDEIPVGESQALELTLPSAEHVKELCGTLSVTEPTPGLKNTGVRIEWRSPNGTPHHVELTSAFSREGSPR